MHLINTSRKNQILEWAQNKHDDFALKFFSKENNSVEDSFWEKYCENMDISAYDFYSIHELIKQIDKWLENELYDNQTKEMIARECYKNYYECKRKAAKEEENHMKLDIPDFIYVF